jgi:acetylglutamate kinase
MGIESKFEGGLRVTDEKTVEIVEMVLAGSINKEIVALINQTGEWAIGLCGKDGNMVFAEKAKKTIRDPDSATSSACSTSASSAMWSKSTAPLLDLLARSEMIPVIAPVAPGRDGHDLQHQRGHLRRRHRRRAQCATRLLFLTDVPGVLNKDRANSSSSSPSPRRLALIKPTAPFRAA